jgi:hypothetical protein
MAPRLSLAMPRGTYAKSKACHLVIRQGLGHAIWQLYTLLQNVGVVQ